MTTSTERAPRAAHRHPSRFREAEDRNLRIGRTLRRVARVDRLDQDLMESIGEQLRTCDRLGARLADAMRMRAGAPGAAEERVSRPALRAALAGELDLTTAPPALRAFMDEAHAVPDWVDWDLLAEGQRVYHRFGQNAADVLTALSLIGGYRFGGPTDLLVATGGLAGESTRRRLAETQAWAASLSTPDGLRPGGEAWRLTLHVRAMHALVNASFAPGWDVERWGLPVNDTDQAATLGLFDAVVLLGVRTLGVPVGREESRAVMHLWRYVGHLMGVGPQWLVDSERERHRLNYHLLISQAGITPAGGELARAIVTAQAERSFVRLPRTSRLLARERLLSLLTVFLGPTSMQELGLPRRPPWAHAYLVPLNTWRYQVLGRSARGRRRLDAQGTRVRERILASYYGSSERDLAQLPD